MPSYWGDRAACVDRRDPPDFRLQARQANDLKTQSGRKIRRSTLTVLALCLMLPARGQQPSASVTNVPPALTVVLPKSVPDPLEPVNRVLWAFNKGLLSDVIKPTSKVYRLI